MPFDCKIYLYKSEMKKKSAEMAAVAQQQQQQQQLALNVIWILSGKTLVDGLH